VPCRKEGVGLDFESDLYGSFWGYSRVVVFGEFVVGDLYE
jgi:hypothetical protein